ncbi:MAG: histidine triad nucleotide-binding protein [Syntrophomonadaceae bacterium]|nr:histidine triad nucleotide-binding protein [Syntrophomonadaceae bacterium]
MSSCLFCQIIAKKIPSQIVYEDDQLVAFKDINPVAPTHILLIPRKHLSGLNEVTDADRDLLGYIQIQAARLAQQAGIAENGYRLVTNCGVEGGQTSEHLHYHLLGGRSMQWPPG